MNKKATSMSIIIWLVSAVVIIFFLAGYLYFFHSLTNSLTAINIDTTVVNFSKAVQSTIVPIDTAINSLTWISFILIISLAFGILIENFYIRQHPVLFFIHIMIVIVAVIGAIYISNEYETLMSTGTLASTISSFSASSYIILNLPIWVAVIGVVGFILLVINANRDPEIRVRGGI